VTHALLPVFLLRRRLGPAAVIGSPVARMVRGAGARPAADALGVPHTTARDWRRRHRARASAWLARRQGDDVGVPTSVGIPGNALIRLGGILQAIDAIARLDEF
jgi:hypothetical protein